MTRRESHTCLRDHEGGYRSRDGESVTQNAGFLPKEDRDSPVQKLLGEENESPKGVVTLSWGHQVLGNDNWKTRIKSAREK